MLPSHGKIECRKCFTDSTKINKPHPEWSIINDPGAWGNNTPKYLVLGFSKGSTQANAYDQGAFNDVAFARMRPRLTAILQKLELLKKEASVDSVIADPEGDFAFGSLIRCSVSRFDKKLSTENLYSSIMISNADHTFSSRSSRTALIKALLENPL